MSSISAIDSQVSQAASLAAGGNAAALRHLPANEQVKAAAGQFEAVLVRQFLEQSVGKLMGSESGGAGAGVYGYLLTDILANKLTAGGGLGLSSVIQHQLTPRAGLADDTATKGTS